MMSMMRRPDDIIREPHSSHVETDEEDGSIGMPEANLHSYEDLRRIRSHDEETVHTNDSEGENNWRRQAAPCLSKEETVQLVYRKVESALKETQRSLVASEAATDVVKPKLTIDLSRSDIAGLPDAVVDIVKDDVETYVPSPQLGSPMENYGDILCNTRFRS